MTTHHDAPDYGIAIFVQLSNSSVKVFISPPACQHPQSVFLLILRDLVVVVVVTVAAAVVVVVAVAAAVVE